MRNDSEALQYLREVSARMTEGYPEDCVAHACRLAVHLLRAGGSPWIGSIRDITMNGDQQFHQPLIALRLKHPPPWNVHYVCCNDGDAYDPLVGEPVAIDELALRVFGRALSVREAVSAERVRALGSEDALRAHLRTLRFAAIAPLQR
jgi:hypothetical protein